VDTKSITLSGSSLGTYLHTYLSYLRSVWLAPVPSEEESERRTAQAFPILQACLATEQVAASIRIPPLCHGSSPTKALTLVACHSCDWGNWGKRVRMEPASAFPHLQRDSGIGYADFRQNCSQRGAVLAKAYYGTVQKLRCVVKSRDLITIPNT
jgi:hypothetical protein